MILHGRPMMARPGYRVTTGEVAARSLSFRQDQRSRNPSSPTHLSWGDSFWGATG